MLPSVFDPSFTVGAKYLIRAMFGGLDSFPLLAVPMFVLSGIIMAKGGISKKLFDVFAYFLGKFTAGMPCAVIVTCLFYEMCIRDSWCSGYFYRSRIYLLQSVILWMRNCVYRTFCTGIPVPAARC